ncbi:MULTISPECIES: transglutaminase family protein [unclassified Luteococcus]|uniref:transglutaminase family protein n=1 Tax=unclassified Luteococcus TaxID=2639923 RepID=UPI00313C67F4
MRSSDRLTIAVALAMVLGSVSLMPLTLDRHVVAYAAVLVVTLQAISLVLRRVNLPGAVVHLVQFLVLLAAGVAWGYYAQPEATRSITRLPSLLNHGVMQIRTEVAPMSESPHSRWIFLLMVGIVTIIADILVVTLQATAWMLAPLLSLYLIPALALKHDVDWWVFALLGFGYLAVLIADGLNDNSAWTRNLASDSARNPHSSTGALRLAALVGVPALALAVLLGAVTPKLGEVDIQSARPRGSGPLEMTDPTIDLSKNLNLPADRTVLTYKADQPLYLRTASLTVMDAEGWHMAPVQLRDGALPTAPGLTEAGKSVSVDVSVKDLGGEYLPAPYAPQGFNADGRWRYDPQTLTILSTQDKDRTEAIRNLDYQVSAVLNDPGAENFTLAKVGTPSDAKVTSAVPDNVPKAIMDITTQVTRDASTPVLKAAAIQAYLADPENFNYSTTAPTGDGFDVLTNFLTKDKAGYCVHFASAMALMARLEGIPSRVSVGFLPGEKVGDHYEVKASNMHAWPELYFANYGWVRFEPTSRVASAPEWSLVNKDVKPLPSATASSGASSKNPSKSPSATPSPSASPSAGPTTPGPTTRIPWSRLLGWSLALLGVLGLLSLPGIIRLVSRRRRLDARAEPHQRVANAWAEIRDTRYDLGLAWPNGTPREVAAVLADQLDDDGLQAMDRVSMDVERSRYARTLGDLDQALTDDTRLVRSQLLAGSTKTDRFFATWAPRSLWLRLTGRADRGDVVARRLRQQADQEDQYIS